MGRRIDLNEQRRELVREQILNASRRVVLERGVGGLTLSAIARDLELTKAALYYYFDSKDALIFELSFQAHANLADAVGAAVAQASSGPEALEALIRATSRYFYKNLDDLRLAYMVPQIDLLSQLTPEALARVRPFNEVMFGSVARLISADQGAGRLPKSIDGRRLAFTAHLSVLGVLTMEGLVERVNDPLIHVYEAMVDELVAAFVGRLKSG
ncbi:MAG: TetR/AcrR family transcriptional regulator [Alphaproteobacteria bacterium]|nr:TetR/AcrR family transcriptional regulator [Alphaproteobacteria bacterium]